MKTMILLGGGSLKEKSTLEIDKYVANLAKARAGEKRAYGLFVGTASHDFMPAFNSFRKTYTSVFDIKADCLLTVNVDTPDEKIDEKLTKADFIYVGGGDTLFMLEKWQERGLVDKIKSAYERGVIIVGLSAGAVCWFENMFTDSEILNGKSQEYKLYGGLGVLNGTMCPHYNLRKTDFESVVLKNKINFAYAVEDNCAIVFKDGEFVKSISSGGNAYRVCATNGKVLLEKI